MALSDHMSVASAGLAITFIMFILLSCTLGCSHLIANSKFCDFKFVSTTCSAIA